jgi:hypothetical protein
MVPVNQGLQEDLTPSEKIQNATVHTGDVNRQKSASIV